MSAQDGKAGQGHPLPASEEARTGELPEHLILEKGTGDDAEAAVQPEGDPVAPDSEGYQMGGEHAARRNRGQSPVRDSDCA